MSFAALSLFFMIAHGSLGQNKFPNILESSSDDEANFQLFLQEVMVKSLVPYKCVVVITDDVYGFVFQQEWFHRFGSYITFIMLYVTPSEDLFSPFAPTKQCLQVSKNEGCQMYIILLSNSPQVERLLRFSDRYRMINTKAKFVLLNDNRLFDKTSSYLWKRIINVIFVKEHKGQKQGELKKKMPWLEVSTVPFPAPISSVLVPRRLDIWSKSKFLKGADLFKDKTSNLRNQTLKVAIFDHIPGTVRKSQGAKLAPVGEYSGTEVEILKTTAMAMNFQYEIYEPANIELELWGQRTQTGKYTGLLGEMVNSKADIALGDLYYTPYYLDLMDLSLPYNTECLTFLTPQSLTDHSWKTLILPFKPVMWGVVLVVLILSALVFYSLAGFHKHTNKKTPKRPNNGFVLKPKNQVMTVTMYPNVEKMNADKYVKMMDLYKTQKLEPNAGLYQFTEPFNSFLYTYSMLLQVSLPVIPTGWSLRVLTGWYWIYCLLLVVSYRASMTAILARPTPSVKIDTLEELIDSQLPSGGWGEITRDFFRSSFDPITRKIGVNFQLINDSIEAVDRVADASFAFYENSYFLEAAVVKRQLRFQTENPTGKGAEDRHLHIMNECVIKMPISIGLQKNSPIKHRMDKTIRTVLEAGLVKKWLDDVMSPIYNAQIPTNTGETKAIMNMAKLFAVIVALLIGYGVSSLMFLIELIYFHYAVKTNPSYNRYTKSIEGGRKAK